MPADSNQGSCVHPVNKKRGRLDALDSAFVILDEYGIRTHIPVGGRACLMLESGRSADRSTVPRSVSSPHVFPVRQRGFIRRMQQVRGRAHVAPPCCATGPTSCARWTQHSVHQIRGRLRACTHRRATASAGAPAGQRGRPTEHDTSPICGWQFQVVEPGCLPENTSMELCVVGERLLSVAQ